MIVVDASVMVLALSSLNAEGDATRSANRLRGDNR